MQEAKVWLSSLLEVEYSIIISKLPMDVGRTNLFLMDIPMTGPPVTHKPYPIPLKYQKFVTDKIQLLGKADHISKSLSLWTAPVIIGLKKARSLKPS